MILGILILNRSGAMRLKKIYDESLFEIIDGKQSSIGDTSESFMEQLQAKMLKKYA